MPLDEMADRRPRPLVDGEAIELGGKRVRHIDTPTCLMGECPTALDEADHDVASPR